MKTLNNGFIADVFPTEELKKMQAEITRVLKGREEEREKTMHEYQDKLDDLLETIRSDGFGIKWDEDYGVPVVFYEEDD